MSDYFLTAVPVTASIFCTTWSKNYILENSCIRYSFTLSVAFVGVIIDLLGNFAVNVNRKCSVDAALQPRLESGRESDIY